MKWGSHQTGHLASVPCLLQNADFWGETEGFTVNYKVSDENYALFNPS